MILDFYWRVWQRSGLIHNAQAIGYPGIFHRHENDETEITGYLVVQAFDYYRKTRDTAFLREIMPMLEWATEAQQRNLIDGMLPFNGDETYIAGGVVPRQVMYHGSAEATLLFVEGSRRLIRFVREQGLWSAARIGALERDADECSERFRDNFCRDGHLYVNNPRRERKVAYPPTRPGVCLYPGHFDYFPETYHFKGCLYFCKDCMTKDHAAVELPEPELFSIPSANLVSRLYRLGTFLGEREAGVFGRCDRVVRTNRENFRTGSHTGLRLRHVPLCVVRDGTSVAGRSIRTDDEPAATAPEHGSSIMSTAGRAVAAAVRGRAASISRRRSVMPDNAEVAVPGFGQCTLRRFRFTASVGNRAGLRTRFPVRSAAFQRRTADIRNGIDVSERAVVAGELQSGRFVPYFRMSSK